MIPTTFGLAVLQINTLLDSLLARGLSVAPGEPDRIAWLGGVRYPMAQGAAAAVWYGERIYQFPLGLLGIAVATVIFPLLSRHAARGDFARVGADLTLGLRWFCSAPCLPRPDCFFWPNRSPNCSSSITTSRMPTPFARRR